MTFPFKARCPRAKWCCFVLVTIAAVVIWGYSSNDLYKAKLDLKSQAISTESQYLASTLVNASEIASISCNSNSKPTGWNPEPQWNKALMGAAAEFLPRQENPSTENLPIPEAFPLAPRRKNEPPAIGDALVHAPTIVGQIQPLDTDRTQPVSPFAVKPAVPSHRGELARPLPSLATKGLSDRPSGWPDQTYTASAPKESSGETREPMMPHLLTGASVRSTETVAPPPIGNSLRPITPTQPPTGNYILQPMRK